MNQKYAASKIASYQEAIVKNIDELQAIARRLEALFEGRFKTTIIVRDAEVGPNQAGVVIISKDSVSELTRCLMRCEAGKAGLPGVSGMELDREMPGEAA